MIEDADLSGELVWERASACSPTTKGSPRCREHPASLAEPDAAERIAERS